MDQRQRQSLREFFQQLRKAEEAQDVIKRRLHSLKSLFEAVARGKPRVCPGMMAAYFENKVRMTEDDLYAVFNKFDHKLEGSFSFEEFRQELTPIQEATNATSGLTFRRVADPAGEVLHRTLRHSECDPQGPREDCSIRRIRFH